MEEGKYQNNNGGSGIGTNNNSQSTNTGKLDFLSNIGKSIEYSIERDIDYGYGNIDVIWNISLHPSLPQMKWAFIQLQSQEGNPSSQDWQDNQYSLRKIEEAIMRGLRSGMDRAFLVADNEDMARSISGKVEWLASFGSLIRFDTISLGISPDQEKSTIIVPSQQRVPEGEKIRKENIKEREEKLDKYNRPKGERAEQESVEEKLVREISIDENSRPADQKEFQ